MGTCCPRQSVYGARTSRGGLKMRRSCRSAGPKGQQELRPSGSIGRDVVFLEVQDQAVRCQVIVFLLKCFPYKGGIILKKGAWFRAQMFCDPLFDIVLYVISIMGIRLEKFSQLHLPAI